MVFALKIRMSAGHEDECLLGILALDHKFESWLRI